MTQSDKTYKKAISIYNESISLDENNNIISYNVIIEEEKKDSSVKMRINIDKSAIRSSKKLNKKETMRSSKKMCSLKILLMVLFLLSIPVSLLPLMFLSNYSVYSIEKTYDHIVVLGNKSPGNGLSEDMKCRLDCLLKYIDDSTNSTIIVSGGDGEANKMKEYLLNQGIPDDLIVLEEYSKDTYENLENTRSLVTGNVLVITSDYHVFRTKLLCNKLNLDWDILPAKSESTIIFKAYKECAIVYWELLGMKIVIPLMVNVIIIFTLFRSYKCRDDQNSMSK